MGFEGPGVGGCTWQDCQDAFSPPSRVGTVVSWTKNLPEDGPAAARGLGSSRGALRPSVLTTGCGGGGATNNQRRRDLFPAFASGRPGGSRRAPDTAQATPPEPGALPRSFGASEADARGAPKGRQGHGKVTSFSTVPSRPRIPRIVWGLLINVGAPPLECALPRGGGDGSRGLNLHGITARCVLLPLRTEHATTLWIYVEMEAHFNISESEQDRPHPEMNKKCVLTQERRRVTGDTGLPAQKNSIKHSGPAPSLGRRRGLGDWVPPEA